MGGVPGTGGAPPGTGGAPPVGADGSAPTPADGSVSIPADAGDNPCGPGLKFCGGLCVEPSPGVGCSMLSCTPCEGVNATGTCNGELCVLSCNQGYSMSGGQCVADASCQNGEQDNAETDVDCGGDLCPQCENGQSCQINGDCATNNCASGTCSCAPSCPIGNPCSGNGDCASGVCADVCVAAGCGDGVKNGGETDVDCGGPDCGPCGPGKVCGGPSDCTSFVCTGGICQEPLCTDSVKNGTETDVDCGGSCDPCANGSACLADSDCVSGFCNAGTCAPMPPYLEFPYTPSNFNPSGVSAQAMSPLTYLNCGESVFNSETGAFSNFCGQQEPSPVLRTQTNGPDMVILPFRNITIAAGSSLRIVGTRAVVLAVFGDVELLGTINANATSSAAGAGGNQVCTDSTGANGTSQSCDCGWLCSNSPGGGGGGGGHRTTGATGGRSSAGAGGAARGDTTVIPLLGGCRGGSGARCAPGAGGHGGGVVQLSVAGELVLRATSVVRANGSNGGNAGSGCDDDSSGGGGGSGGSIVLEGNSVVLTNGGILEANGGSGGNGRGNNSGGNGGTLASNPGTGTANSCNGGSGGGGASGRVRVRGSSCSGLPATGVTWSCP
jgi:hypothetical protein